MDSRKRKLPATLMLDSDRLAKSEALSRGSDEADEPAHPPLRGSIGREARRP